MISSKNEYQPCDLIIFGAKGDLSRRKLIPALYKLEKNKKIHPESKIIGVGRANWTNLEFSEIMYSSLKQFVKDDKINKMIWNNLKKRMIFFNLDINDKKKFIKLYKLIDNKKRLTISYLAVSPNHFKAICQGLASIKLNKFPSRIILEKPLGNSFKSSCEINNEVSKFFQEKQIFRIDHYLGKETILNLLTLRFANNVFFSNWNYQTIDHIQITVSEDMGIEGRWSYFDKIGQMRDMVQNHLLQILTIIAMSPPDNLLTDNIRNEKLKILKSLRLINKTNVQDYTIRGQYIKGTINGKKVPGYLEEGGIEKNSNTETFVFIKVFIDNWRWKKVPFYLRTGKRLLKKYSEIVIYFKNPVINLFNKYKKLPHNKLIIRLQPNEGITMQILNKFPDLDENYNLKKVNLEFCYSKIFSKITLYDAYERLLLESMRGIQSLFVSRNEVEESWKWIDSIINAWNICNSKMHFYHAGTVGPKYSIDIIENDGRIWHQ